MILHVDGDIKPSFAQALALLFFPGSKFPLDESESDDGITLELTIAEHDDTASATAVIYEKGTASGAEYTVADCTARRVKHKTLIQLAAGGAMLRAGKKHTGAFPPWGMLTGVRPAKTALTLLEETGDTDFVIKILEDDYMCTPARASLAVSAAKRESAFINDRSRRECSVYIAIPFCPTRCSYCSFVSFSSKRLLSMIPQYLKKLERDISDTFSLIRELGLRVSCVYIGGGTPTVLDAEQLDFLLSALGREADISELDEFTLEAGRPDTITAEKLSVAAEHGVGRISVNPQTLNDEVLREIGRAHTAEDFLRAYEIAGKSGINAINVDLIAGLPGESAESFAKSVNGVIKLAPQNITVHTFYAKRASQLAANNPSVFRIEDRQAAESVDYARNTLCSAGFAPYYLYRQKNTAANLENVGYTQPGYEGIYNIMMMEEVHSVFGAGASAMTKLVSPDVNNMKIIRICEKKYPYEYLDEDDTTQRRELRQKACDFYARYSK